MSLAHLTSPPLPSKPARPAKPYAAFPFYFHASGRLAKKVRGRVCYFGKWHEVDAALALWNEQKADLLAGRTPRPDVAALTVRDACNAYLNAKRDLLEAGELSGRTWEAYRAACDLLVAKFGKRRLVSDLQPSDFALLRKSMSRRWGPTRLVTETVRVKSVFKFALDTGLIDHAIRYGPQFKPPSASVLRRHRAQSGERMIEADQLRAILGAADSQMRVMALLALGGGLGNTDCAQLEIHHVNLKTGWVHFPRPKTGVERRFPLWDETREALRELIGDRTEGKVFLNERGTPMIRVTDRNHTDLIAVRFSALLKKLGMHRAGLGFYTLRRVFRTIADGARDPVACDIVMGHHDASMGATYRQRVADERLRAVVGHVRAWLFGAEGVK